MWMLLHKLLKNITSVYVWVLHVLVPILVLYDDRDDRTQFFAYIVVATVRIADYEWTEYFARKLCGGGALAEQRLNLVISFQTNT